MAPKKAFVKPEPEPEFEDEEMDLSVEDEDEEEDEDYAEGMDVGALMESLFTTDDGDNVCTALVSINQNLEALAKAADTQNKILVKLLAHFTKPN
jgi:hypothetical protein